LREALHQGGIFDWQRHDGTFYEEYRPASNYGVGITMNGAGYNLEDTVNIAETYAYFNSSNADQMEDDKQWWIRGWTDAQNGMWNKAK
jgi:hypothetical protein